MYECKNFSGRLFDKANCVWYEFRGAIASFDSTVVTAYDAS